MRPFLRLWAFCVGLVASACTAQPVHAVRQDIGERVTVQVVDRTSHHCWIEHDGPRQHAEAQLVRHGFRPVDEGGSYRIRIEVTGERSERFSGHVQCVGFLRVVVDAPNAPANARPVLERTLPVRASNAWPDFYQDVLRAIDEIIGGL